MDLATRENCLLCGAYECTALEKPLILSDSRALREYFNQGVVYTPNNAKGIAQSITEGVQNIAALAAQIKVLKQNLLVSWAKKLDASLAQL